MSAVIIKSFITASLSKENVHKMNVTKSFQGSLNSKTYNSDKDFKKFASRHMVANKSKSKQFSHCLGNRSPPNRVDIIFYACRQLRLTIHYHICGPKRVSHVLPPFTVSNPAYPIDSLFVFHTSLILSLIVLYENTYFFTILLCDSIHKFAKEENKNFVFIFGFKTL